LFILFTVVGTAVVTKSKNVRTSYVRVLEVIWSHSPRCYSLS